MTERLSLEQIQQVEFEMISFIVDFCKAQNLKVFLDSGTLLGAVRYGGFIPWDDDADLIMERNDYEKFRRLFKDEGRYQMTDDNYPSAFIKIYDTRTILIENRLRKPVEIGIYIDIFPVDVLPEDPNRKKKYFQQIAKLTRLFRIRVQKIRNPGRGIRSWTKRFAYAIGGLLPEKRLKNKLDKSASQYKNTNSHLRTQMMVSWNPEKQLEADWLRPGRTIDFLGVQMPIPLDTEAYLTELYGADYMTPPPADQIEPHTYEAYWKE